MEAGRNSAIAETSLQPFLSFLPSSLPSTLPSTLPFFLHPLFPLYTVGFIFCSPTRLIYMPHIALLHLQKPRIETEDKASGITRAISS